MHDVLRQRLLRRIESLPEEQVYQVLDFIEFLESKYARDLQVEATGLQSSPRVWKTRCAGRR